MKMNFLSVLSSILLSFFITSAVAAPETYKIDPLHTYVIWRVSHFGFSDQAGKWMATGNIQLDEEKPQNSKVDVTINVADFITGIAKLDEHLKSEDFFDVAKYPTATFVSDKIQLTGKDSGKIYGNLTLHGVTKSVVLTVKLRRAGVSPITNKKTIGFTASTTLKRSDFGIKAYLPGIGDQVKIEIEAEANKS